MRTSSLKRFARAACLIVAAGLAFHAAAAAGSRTARAAGPCTQETVLRGRGLVTFGGYELNVTFTTGGRLVRFDITGAS